MSTYSQTWTWIDGKWTEGNPPLLGPRTHAMWLASSVFDGARAFEGTMPDIRGHAQRVNDSAGKMGLNATLGTDEIVDLAGEGVKRFGQKPALYVRPMYWAEADGPSSIMPDAESTQFALCLFEAAMPGPTASFSVTKGAFRRPSYETAPTDAKAGCLYPNNARVLRVAKEAGFDNALVLDMLGNVAETGTSNIFLAKDGVVKTPAPNGTFLNGITRQRVIALFKDAGVSVEERTVKPGELDAADEIFSTGNHGKVVPCVRYESRALEAGPMYRQARELYWAFAHSRSAVSARG